MARLCRISKLPNQKINRTQSLGYARFLSKILQLLEEFHLTICSISCKTNSCYFPPISQSSGFSSLFCIVLIRNGREHFLPLIQASLKKEHELRFSENSRGDLMSYRLFFLPRHFHHDKCAISCGNRRLLGSVLITMGFEALSLRCAPSLLLRFIQTHTHTLIHT